MNPKQIAVPEHITTEPIVVSRVALLHVVTYLFAEESRHWKEAGRPAQHIYHDVVKLWGELQAHDDATESAAYYAEHSQPNGDSIQ